MNCMISLNKFKSIFVVIENLIPGLMNIFTVHSLLGFSPLIVSSCNSTFGDIRVIYLNHTLDLDAFLNPVALLLCYYALIISSGFILDAKVKPSSSLHCQPKYFIQLTHSHSCETFLCEMTKMNSNSCIHQSLFVQFYK